MQHVLAVFRSRLVAMQAYNYLLSKGVVAALVSTPSKLRLGCGLSVKMPFACLAHFKGQLSAAETFVGFFLVTQTLQGIVYLPL